MGFESGNAEKPFMLGAMYNGAEVSGFHTPNNDLKVERTRSGIEGLANDAEGSYKRSTPDGNFLHFDGQGNATLNVPKDLLIQVGGNLTINVGENQTINVSMNSSETVGMNKTEVAGMNIFQNASMDYSLNATNITKIASENYSYEANDIHKTATENIDVSAGKEYTQNSEETVQNLSGEKGHNA